MRFIELLVDFAWQEIIPRLEFSHARCKLLDTVDAIVMDRFSWQTGIAEVPRTGGRMHAMRPYKIFRSPAQ
jgi:hypothetical protein